MNSDTSLREMATVAIVLAAVLAACGKPSDSGTAVRRSPASEIGVSVTDTALVSQVNAVLIADDKRKAGRIEVEAEGGRVTLSGTVPDNDSQQRAARLAAMVPGVRSVYNRLVVSDHG